MGIYYVSTMIREFKPTIFLDIDGCLATSKEYYMSREKFWVKNPIAERLKVPYPYNEKCVKIFNNILNEIGPQIILSSDWKHHWTLDEIDKIFIFNGIIQSPIDVTPNFNISHTDFAKNRAFEIETYIKKHHLTSYVIVDDLDMTQYFEPPHFIKTRETEGFKQCGLKQKILNAFASQ